MNTFLSEDQELYNINHIFLTTWIFLRKKWYKKKKSPIFMYLYSFEK